MRKVLLAIFAIGLAFVAFGQRPLSAQVVPTILPPNTVLVNYTPGPAATKIGTPGFAALPANGMRDYNSSGEWYSDGSGNLVDTTQAGAFGSLILDDQPLGLSEIDNPGGYLTNPNSVRDSSTVIEFLMPTSASSLGIQARYNTGGPNGLSGNYRAFIQGGGSSSTLSISDQIGTYTHTLATSATFTTTTGTQYIIKFDVSGAFPTTLTAKLFTPGSPATQVGPTLTTTDSTANQGPLFNGFQWYGPNSSYTIQHVFISNSVYPDSIVNNPVGSATPTPTPAPTATPTCASACTPAPSPTPNYTLAPVWSPVPSASPTALQGSNSAVAWETTSTQSLNVVPTGPVLGAGSADTTVTVNPTSTNQPVFGMGAAVSQNEAYYYFNLPPNNRQAFMASMFSPQGAGLQFVRIFMDAASLQTATYTLDDQIPNSTDPGGLDFNCSPDDAVLIPFLQAALVYNPNLRFYTTPWTWPQWGKTPRSMFGNYLSTTVGPNAAQYSGIAQYFVNFDKCYASRGINISYNSVENEPTNGGALYGAMPMSQAQEIAFIDVLGPALASAGLSTKVMGLDDTYTNEGTAANIVSDATAGQYVPIVGFHCASGGVSTAGPAFHAAAPTKLQMTSECDMKPSRDTLPNESGYITAAWNNYESAFLYYIVFAPDFEPNQSDGMETINIYTGALKQNPAWSYAAEFSHAVTANATEVSSSTTNSVIQEACFVNADVGATHACMLYNNDTAAHVVAVTDSGLGYTTNITMPAGSLWSIRYGNNVADIPSATSGSGSSVTPPHFLPPF